MKIRTDGLTDFSAELHLATLRDVAHADGLQEVEQAWLESQATLLGINLDRLPEVPGDLSSLSWTTRVLVLRDAIVLSLADSDEISPEEQEFLEKLADRMRVPQAVLSDLRSWVFEQGRLMDRLSGILEKPSE